MRYPVLEQSNARLILEKRRAGEEFEIEGLVKYRGQGELLDSKIFATLFKSLEEVRKDFPEKLRHKDPLGAKFESRACTIVHPILDLDLEILSDPDFWVYISVIELPNIVEWRFPGKDGGLAHTDNYGLGNRMENLSFRMWLRAEIVSDEIPEKKYDLAKRGDIDLWRSHIIRQNYANSRALARALVRFQYPDDSPEKARLSIDGIRKLAKRLRRLCVNLVSSMLDEEAAFKLVEKEAALVVS